MSGKVTDFVRSSSDRLSARFSRKTPVIVAASSTSYDGHSSSNKHNRRGDHDIELQPLKKTQPQRSSRHCRPCVICVGTTGSGKSSTISRYTGQRAPSSAGVERVTQECGLYESLDGLDGPVWVDTVGWEDSAYDDELSFQDILRFLQDNDISQIKAIVWNVIPNIRRDNVLVKQARFIDMFKPGEIWRNVIVVCKQSMKPERDGSGAVRAAEEMAGFAPQVVGYRFIGDLDEDQRSRMEADAECRNAFNVKTDEEVREALAEKLAICGRPIDLVFRRCKCVDCGFIGDPRLMPIYCHMEMARVHTQGVVIVHPLPVETYHESDVQIAEHDGVLLLPWYGRCSSGLGPRRYTCCGRKHGKPGCVVKWACCRRAVPTDYNSAAESANGCRRRYGCCGEDPSLARDGCEARYLCCGSRSDGGGCAQTCRKCGKEWGTPAVNNCFRKKHNVVDNWEALEQQQQDRLNVSSTAGNGDLFDVTFSDSEGCYTQNNNHRVKMVFGLPPIILPKGF